ncbi:uncharacterized protein LODBEIA_P06890 [Lodderomyces beijingensis]|uniref:Uncharacterized protein n=1 Tax=Lodderomyces beijingensis TaxID=1775926 RepID=A0ABP0ZJJ0_9ASCO
MCASHGIMDHGDPQATSYSKLLNESLAQESDLDLGALLTWIRNQNTVDADDDYDTVPCSILEDAYTAMSLQLNLRIKNLRHLSTLVGEFLERLGAEEEDFCLDSLSASGWVGQLRRLIVCLFKEGGDFKSYNMLLRALRSSNQLARLVILDLMNRICNDNPKFFPFMICSQQVNFPFKNSITDSFTIYTWFRVESTNHWEETITICTLTCSDPSTEQNNTIFKVQLLNLEQVAVVIENPRTKSRSRFSFNHIFSFAGEQQQQQMMMVQLVLIYNRSTLSLYLNGQHSESIPCAGLSKESITWNKISIGCDLEDKDARLMIRNMTLLRCSLSREWILVLFYLGAEYNWDFKDMDKDSVKGLVNRLTKTDLMEVSKNLMAFRNGGSPTLAKAKASSNTTSNRLGQERCGAGDKGRRIPVAGKFLDPTFIVDTLSRVKEDSVLFDSNELLRHLMQRQKGFASTAGNQFSVHVPMAFYDAIRVTGTPNVILDVINQAIHNPEVQLRDSIIFSGLNLLLSLSVCNWRLRDDFVAQQGYGIVSVLMHKFKSVNPSLTLDLSPFLQKPSGMFDRGEANLLDVFLKYSLSGLNNPYQFAISNPVCFKHLLLDFSLYQESGMMAHLFGRIEDLLEHSKFQTQNTSELKSMKLARKVFHYLKSPTAKVGDKTIDDPLKSQLLSILESILEQDPSYDTIHSATAFIVFALHNPEASSSYGILTLEAITNHLCRPTTPIKTLRRFSRWITIQWLLVLFDTKIDVVVFCGVKILTRLLKTLNSVLIKRFFITNHGLDILTETLKPWWNSDCILELIFLSSFAANSQRPERGTVYRSRSTSTSTDSICFPELILLANNLILNSMYSLSSSTGNLMGSNPSTPSNGDTSAQKVCLENDVLSRINTYIGWIQNYGVIEKMIGEKDFMESLVELLGFLKLGNSWFDDETQSNIKDTQERMVSVLVDSYVSSLSSTKFETSLKKLSDFAIKVLCEMVFPGIFRTVTEELVANDKASIPKERRFWSNVSELLSTFHGELISQDFSISSSTLNSYIICLCSFVESNPNSSGRMKQILGECIMLNLSKLVSEPCPLGETFTDFIKELLYRQVIITDKNVLGDDKVAALLQLLLGLNLTQAEPNQRRLELSFGLLRSICLLRQNDTPNIIKSIDLDDILLDEFFTNLTSRNDVDTLQKLKKYPPFVKALSKSVQTIKTEVLKKELKRVSDIIKVALHNGGRLGQMNSIYIKACEKDCQMLKAQEVTSELASYNKNSRARKDRAANWTRALHSCVTESSRIYDPMWAHTYVLDYIENANRMRKRLVVEDLLPDSEKLDYEMDIPLKEVANMADSLDEYDYGYDFANISGTLQELSLSSDNGGSREPLPQGLAVDENEPLEGNASEDKNKRVSSSMFVGDHIVSLWNVSQINGLVPAESLLILGSTHLYLFENYFLGEDGNVLDITEAPAELRDPILRLVNSQTKIENESKPILHRMKSWDLTKFSAISKRQFLLRDNAFEMFFSDGATVLTTCISRKERDVIYSKLKSVATGKGINVDLAKVLSSNAGWTFDNAFSTKLVNAFSSGMAPAPSYVPATKKWKRGEMSNFDYLMIINTLAGRTFNDLTQYPVFPWVLSDYSSTTLDLSNPRTFRDLSKPMGAQTEKRASQFKERFDALNSFDDHSIPAFHYGTHYSSAMIVTSYLIRLKPFVHSYLLLQGGKFDHADRLFNSIEKAWLSASRDNSTDVRELTPEFFCLPEFLTNANQFDFGLLQNGSSVNNVELPPWACNDPHIFIAKNREALESPYVSANLHSWIDLIFGFKQDGAEAINALNVFHHSSYNGAIDLDNIDNEMEKKAAIGMINNFGQTPSKVFDKPHVMRDVLNLPNLYLTDQPSGKVPAHVVFESKSNSPMLKLEKTSGNDKAKWVGRPTLVSGEDGLLIRKSKRSNSCGGTLVINEKLFIDIHPSDITAMRQIGNRTFLIGGEEGLISAWKCTNDQRMTVENEATLRGHFSPVADIASSKSFGVGASIDSEGHAIVWDLTRFAFMHKLDACVTESLFSNFNTVAISDDSGYIATLVGSDKEALLQIFSLNGTRLLSKTFGGAGGAMLVAFGESDEDTNGQSGESTASSTHPYWSNEVLAIANGKTVEIFEIVCDSSWTLKRIQKLDTVFENIAGQISALRLFKCSKSDNDDCLVRGALKVVVGDTAGKVYSL